jgi:hypothetical protein
MSSKARASSRWVAAASFPLAGILALAFLALAPAAATAALLRSVDPAARLLMAGIAAVVINLLAAEALLALGVWSPGRVLVTVTVVTAALACAAAGSSAGRRRTAVPAQSDSGPAGRGPGPNGGSASPPA